MLASVVAVMTSTSLPFFLVGSLEVEMRSSLSMDVAKFGVALAIYYLVASVASVPGSRLSERIGGDRSLRTAAALSALALLSIAGAVNDWSELVPALMVAGFATSLAQPSANLLLAESFPKTRQGIAFGVKQSAAPLASLLGGVAVPLIALSVGWRWAFASAAAVATVSAIALPRLPGGPRLTRAAAREAGQGMSVVPLLVLSCGFFFGLLAASSLIGFVVASGVAAAHLSRGGAGIVAAVGGGVGVSVRLLVGWRADHSMRRFFLVVAGMLGLGALGYAGLGVGAHDASPVLYAVAAAASFGLGWGWNGLFNFAVVRSYPTAPAWATGITQTGGRLGAMAGPLAFAFIVKGDAYAWAWSFAGVAAVLGAVAVLVGRPLIVREAAGVHVAPAAGELGL